MKYISVTRLIGAFIWACCLTYGTSEMFFKQSGTDMVYRYRINIAGCLLPAALVYTFVAYSVLFGLEYSLTSITGWFVLFFEIGIYYIILIPFLPLLRKHISARTVALLWIVPSYLYAVMMYNEMENLKPMKVINVSNRVFIVIFTVWFVGFIAVLGRNIIGHLSFRRYILKDALPVTDSRILDILREVNKDAGLKKPKHKILISHNVNTPLSIGLFRRKVRIVLPDRYYTDDELKLILKHEVIHIGREDGWSKFSLMFCTAMCWFNPFIWFAMKKCAEDLELSCDETVLIDADSRTRQQYAKLILSTAGDERGFTTCLSASAKALLYRLKNITKPVSRTNGSVLIGIVFFLMALGHGAIAFTYNHGTGRDYIYTEDRYSRYRIKGLSFADVGIADDIDPRAEEAVLKYLSEIKVSNISGRYAPDFNESKMNIHISNPNDRKFIYFFEDSIFVRGLGRGKMDYYYYLPEKIDFDYIIGLTGL